MTALLRHGDLDIFDVIGGLLEGEPLMIAAVVFVFGSIAFFGLYENGTRGSFVRSKKERRRAGGRRKHVIWKYERD